MTNGAPAVGISHVKCVFYYIGGFSEVYHLHIKTTGSRIECGMSVTRALFLDNVVSLIRNTHFSCHEVILVL